MSLRNIYAHTKNSEFLLCSGLFHMCFGYRNEQARSDSVCLHRAYRLVGIKISKPAITMESDKIGIQYSGCHRNLQVEAWVGREYWNIPLEGWPQGPGPSLRCICLEGHPWERVTSVRREPRHSCGSLPSMQHLFFL